MAADPSNPRTDRWHWIGSDVGQNTRDACADRRRAGRAFDLSVLRSRLRPTRLPQGWKIDLHRRRPGESDQPGESLPERRGLVSIAHARSARNKNEISRPTRERMDGDFAG